MNFTYSDLGVKQWIVIQCYSNIRQVEPNGETEPTNTVDATLFWRIYLLEKKCIFCIISVHKFAKSAFCTLNSESLQVETTGISADLQTAVFHDRILTVTWPKYKGQLQNNKLRGGCWRFVGLIAQAPWPPTMTPSNGRPISSTDRLRYQRPLADLNGYALVTRRQATSRPLLSGMFTMTTWPPGRRVLLTLCQS